MEVAKSEEESAAGETTTGEDWGTRTVGKVSVKSEYRKDKVNSSFPKIFTRSTLKGGSW